MSVSCTVFSVLVKSPLFLIHIIYLEVFLERLLSTFNSELVNTLLISTKSLLIEQHFLSVFYTFWLNKKKDFIVCNPILNFS